MPYWVVLLGIANPVVAGAVGEGAVMAGSQAEQIRQETVDGRLTADQSLAKCWQQVYSVV